MEQGQPPPGGGAASASAPGAGAPPPPPQQPGADSVQEPAAAASPDISQEQFEHDSSFSNEGGDAAGASMHMPAWLPEVLRTLAETQRAIQPQHTGHGNGNGNGSSSSYQKQRMLTQIKIDDFSGGKTVTTKQYHAWKKSIGIKQRLHNLTDKELGLILLDQVKGEAKVLLDVLDVEDMELEGGLSMLWSILDKAHEQLEHERADDAYASYEKASRRPGQSMDSWITYLRKTKMEVEAQDPGKVITDREFASKLLRGANIPRPQRAQIYFNCGGKYVSERIETVLRITFPNISSMESKAGLVQPKSKLDLLKKALAGHKPTHTRKRIPPRSSVRVSRNDS